MTALSKSLCYLTLFLLIVPEGVAQLYFPPNDSDEWETIDPATLGWCPDQIAALDHFLETSNSRAFILLKDGKIVLESYYNGHTATDAWYWASAGKTMTATLIGIAQQEGDLDLDDATSDYLGAGWTSLPPDQEDAITVRHQLTMTTGLNDGIDQSACTEPGCLEYLAPPGERWAYHNAPYTLLTDVLESATGSTLNLNLIQKIRTPLGMDGFYFQQDYNRIMSSTARSMARFGLFILAEGNWNGTQILTDTAYFQAMITPSQDLNPSYGYLWWLNGQNQYLLPQGQTVFPGPLLPDAPADTRLAAGKNGQFINVVPSEGMVWIRMGDSPDGLLVPTLLNNEIWQRINALPCATPTKNPPKFLPRVFPNPVTERLNIDWPADTEAVQFELQDVNGRVLRSGSRTPEFTVSDLPSGLYVLHFFTNAGWLGSRKIIRMK